MGVSLWVYHFSQQSARICDKYSGQQFHCKFRCRMCSSVSGGEKAQNMRLLASMQWLCDWNALECRFAQDFEVPARK